MPSLRTLLATALFVPLLAACDSGGSDLTLVGTFSAETDLGTLEEAVLRANLAGTLNGTGPFTVFAPTNAAFTAYLAAAGLTEAEFLANPALASILRLHVVSGEIHSETFVDGQTVTTLNGQTLTLVSTGGGIGFGLDTEDIGGTSNATITAAEIEASNGIVYKINGVLLPAN